eukprot:scaffold633_cov288-Ochromonas_danica.AAC.39
MTDLMGVKERCCWGWSKVMFIASGYLGIWVSTAKPERKHKDGLRKHQIRLFIRQTPPVYLNLRRS